MIYTLTMNPSLDYIVDVENFRMGLTNRTSAEQMLPGGKGLNVSMVLHNLGVETTALGFVAGFTGEEIVRRMQETGVNCDFIRVGQGMSRINMKLRTVDGTEINGLGPELREEDVIALEKKLVDLQSGDTLVLAGSLPKAVPPSYYARLTEQMQAQGVNTVVDASGEVLALTLSKHPFLIKPNRQELSEFFGAALLTETEDILFYAKKMQELGAKNVLVSLGGDGALLLTEDGDVITAKAPEGEVVNSVGAGDSMVAGFIYGYLKESGKERYPSALHYGLSAGSASAFSRELAKKPEVERLYQTLCV